MVRGSPRQKATGLSQGGSSWALGNAGMEALSQEALSSQVTPAAGEGGDRELSKSSCASKNPAFIWTQREGEETNPPLPHNSSAQGTPNHPPAAPCLPRGGDRLRAFVWVNSSYANDSKTSARVKFGARRHILAGKAGMRSHRGWGARDPCPPCPSVPPDAPHSIQPPPAPGGNLSPSPFVAIKRKRDLSRCQTQQALVSPLMTLAQTVPHPPLLSQSYIAQAATCLIYHRYRKGSAQRRPQMPGSDAQCSLQGPGTSPGPGDASSHSSGTSPNPPGLLSGSEEMGRRRMTEPAALLQAAVCTAGVRQGP